MRSQPVQGGQFLDQLREMVDVALDVLSDVGTRTGGPVAPGGPDGSREAARRALAGPLLPEIGGDPAATFRSLVEAYARWSVDLTHPAAVARMQCPPTAVAAAADLVAAVLNQSLHAWESGPFAIELERYVVAELARLAGYGTTAGGTLTAGGSISNLMATVLARDHAMVARLGEQAAAVGLSGLGLRPVVVCSESSHFSVGRAAAVTGIGQQALVRVPTDSSGRMIPEEADRVLSGLGSDKLPVILVACAGSTDLGCVDPLAELAGVARRHGVWLHADAAYGGGALFSQKLRGMLAGLAEADSITMDLHKFGWTPASSGIFLVRDSRLLGPLAQQTTTLNAPDDEAAGYIGLYGSSLQATRRSDALKIAATLGVLGRDGLGEMVDACHGLARRAASYVASKRCLELAAEPVLTTVLFRYRPSIGLDGADEVDAFNAALRRRLMAEGRVLLARTRFPKPGGADRPVYLKLMLLNPATTPEEIEAVVDEVASAGGEQERGVAA